MILPLKYIYIYKLIGPVRDQFLTCKLVNYRARAVKRGTGNRTTGGPFTPRVGVGEGVEGQQDEGGNWGRVLSLDFWQFSLQTITPRRCVSFVPAGPSGERQIANNPAPLRSTLNTAVPKLITSFAGRRRHLFSTPFHLIPRCPPPS